MRGTSTKGPRITYAYQSGGRLPSLWTRKKNESSPVPWTVSGEESNITTLRHRRPWDPPSNPQCLWEKMKYHQWISIVGGHPDRRANKCPCAPLWIYPIWRPATIHIPCSQTYNTSSSCRQRARRCRWLGDGGRGMDERTMNVEPTYTILYLFPIPARWAVDPISLSPARVGSEQNSEYVKHLKTTTVVSESRITQCDHPRFMNLCTVNRGTIPNEHLKSCESQWPPWWRDWMN